MYLLQLFDWYAASISVILICLIEVVMIGWTYGMISLILFYHINFIISQMNIQFSGCQNFIWDIEFMIEKKIHWFWPLCWKYITPTILTVRNLYNYY